MASDLGLRLATILAQTEMAFGDLEAGRSVIDQLSGIELAARRAAGLTEQLLASFPREEIRGKVLAFDPARRSRRTALFPGLELPRIHRARGAGRSSTDPAKLGSSLTQALRGFWMAYQPIVSSRSRRVYGYEALLRCGGSAFDNVGDLIHAALDLGRLQEVGRAIRDRVWKEASRAPEGAKLFVNLHPLDLSDDGLYEIRAGLFEISEQIVLEITEVDSIEGIKDLASRIQRLRAMGFQIAMDDLGAGYAGLVNYTVLEPEIVKIDMSLVRDIDRDPRKQSIVRSMMSLFDELGTVVVAEGIETAEEWCTLVQLGCDLFQGYFFAMPGRFFAVPRWELAPLTAV
jgi:EAL domain-containing protein (putative c-di-GMP-specific phosphodiesterase class I)